MLGTLFNLSMSNLSILDFKLAKSDFNFFAKSDVSTPVVFFKSDFVAKLGKSNLTFTFAPKDFGLGNLENIHSFLLCLFYQSSY